MGCRIMVGTEAGSDREIACLFCSTTGIAFGPVFDDDPAGLDAHDQAQAFCDWLDQFPCDVPPQRNELNGTIRPARKSSDPRCFPVPELMGLYAQWRKERSAEQTKLAAAAPEPSF